MNLYRCIQSHTRYEGRLYIKSFYLAGSIPNRVATVHVPPAGTRKAVLAAATDFVIKDNESGDVGINGMKDGRERGKPPWTTSAIKSFVRW
jgi:hypothetical protein